MLHDEEMQYGLYEYELEELLDELKTSLVADQGLLHIEGICRKLIPDFARQLYDGELPINGVKTILVLPEFDFTERG